MYEGMILRHQEKKSRAFCAYASLNGIGVKTDGIPILNLTIESERLEEIVLTRQPNQWILKINCCFRANNVSVDIHLISLAENEILQISNQPNNFELKLNEDVRQWLRQVEERREVNIWLTDDKQVRGELELCRLLTFTKEGQPFFDGWQPIAAVVLDQLPPEMEASSIELARYQSQIQKRHWN